MIDDGVNNSFLRIDDGVVAVLVVRRIDGVVVRNDKTDPDLPLCSRLHRRREQGGCSSRVGCSSSRLPRRREQGGAVAELAAQNASNPSNGGRLAARAVASPLAPKYGSIGGASIGSSSSRCYDVLPLLLLRRHEVCGGYVS